MHHHFIARRGVSTMILIGLCAASTYANHGPGTSGGGLFTIPGETLKASAWDMSFRLDYTSFDGVSAAQAEARAAASGGFDSIDSSTLTNFALSYGVTDDLQVSAAVGWYWGNNFIDAEDTGKGIESATADPSGLTDLWITAKYRVMKGENGHLSILAGLKLPTGADDQTLSNGELLEPSSQPGSGSYDFLGGFGYSRYLTAHLTLDASVSYTLRTEANDFKVGNRFDAGAALAWRITDAIDTFPNISLFGEVAFTSIMKDEAAGIENPNSGGSTLYLAPGVRARLTNTTALTLSPQFPVWQNLCGAQVDTNFKLTAMLSISF